MVNKISDKLNVNKSTAGNDILPLLIAFHNTDINEKWSEEFKISHKYNLEFREHALISKINLSKPSTKKLIEKYEKKSQIKEKETENITDQDLGLPEGQSKLF